MAQNNKIRTTDLDFDEIKNNLKNYLRGQQKFSDYDFEGSGLSILLDVLAYNTHYNALYNNLAVNEAFLDSASKRSSVVSKAKELGYVPTSSRCATAVVKVVLKRTNISTTSVPFINQGDQFYGSDGNTSYSFYANDTYINTTLSDDNTYVFENVVLKQGQLLQAAFVADGINTSFKIPNPGVDTTTITVTVYETVQLPTVYSESKTFLGVDGDTRVYFLKELDNNYYEIEFGNGVIGKELAAGNTVVVQYMVGSTDLPNGIKSFTYADESDDFTSTVITTIPAYGASAPEGVDDIKWNAPRNYTAQNRCVTVDDYKAIINSLYPNAQSINVWGGEENTPPAYSDVFISVEPTVGERLSEAEKTYILENIINPRKIVTVHPKFVDPTFIKVELTTAFYYNPKETTRAPSEVSRLVTNAIINYNSKYLRKFGGILKYSALSKAIDASEKSIKSSITTLKLHRTVPLNFNKSENFLVDIGNPIYNSGVAEDSVLSTGLFILNKVEPIYLEDLPIRGTDTGELQAFYFAKNGSRKIYLNKSVGTVTYSSGVVNIRDLIITGVEGPEFKLIIKPQSNDVISARNQIVYIPVELIRVTPVIDTVADKYKFSSSRN